MDKYQRVVKLLNQYKSWKVFIENTEELIEKKQVVGVTGVSYEEGSTGETNAFYSTVEEEVLDRAEDISELEEKLERAKKNVERVDRGLEILSDTAENILRLFYIEDLMWFEVAFEVSKSERQCKRIRKRAIKRLITAFYGE